MSGMSFLSTPTVWGGKKEFGGPKIFFHDEAIARLFLTSASFMNSPIFVTLVKNLL